jgi:hypothetical protein
MHFKKTHPSPKIKNHIFFCVLKVETILLKKRKKKKLSLVIIQWQRATRCTEGDISKGKPKGGMGWDNV